TPLDPACTKRNATTTSSTSSAPATVVCAVVRPMTTRSAGLWAIARKPARRAEATGVGSAGGRGSRGTRMTQTADQRNVPAVTAKTDDGPDTASSTPPTAGPANMPTLATVFITAFAAVSSSGVVTSEGRSAPCAGANMVETTDDST